MLFIVQDSVSPGNYRLAILGGRIPMPQADAVGFLNNISNGDCQGGMNYYVFADDEGYNDRYIVMKPFPGVQVDDQGYLKATSQGLEYRREILLRKNLLDEDSGGARRQRRNLRPGALQGLRLQGQDPDHAGHHQPLLSAYS